MSFNLQICYSKYFKYLLFCFCLLQVNFFYAHSVGKGNTYHHGSKSQLAYKVGHYNIKLLFDIDHQQISGYNSITFVTNQATDSIQLNLAPNLIITQIKDLVNKHTLHFKRDSNVFWVVFPQVLDSGTVHTIKVSYHGSPIIAQNPPWKGGFVWSVDAESASFSGVACQLTGASLWLPIKECVADRPDSIHLTYIAPSEYQVIGNGQFIGHYPLVINQLQHTVWEYQVSYPIQSYNITFYLGKFKQAHQNFKSNLGNEYTIDFYYLPKHQQAALKLFEDIPPMLKIYEDLFGEYPFPRDGFKLVQAPYLGMEHQSAIAYGNDFSNGYLGKQMYGVNFDYILVHEAAHEYWGNLITMENPADMWIHETFATYTEALFVEKKYNYTTYLRYIHYLNNGILNDAPIYGNPQLNQTGSRDMYRKGARVVHGWRILLNNDSLFFANIKNVLQHFAYKNVSTADFLDVLLINNNEQSRDYWQAYLYKKDLPEFTFAHVDFFYNHYLRLKVNQQQKHFLLPLQLKNKQYLLGNQYQLINVNNLKELDKALKQHFLFNTNNLQSHIPKR